MKNKFLDTGEKGYHPLKKIKVVVSGLRFAVLTDFSVMYKIVLSMIILIPTMMFNGPLDASIIVLSTGIMISAEIFNTAIEAICDFMKTDYDEKIGIIKDVSAAATGVTIIVWLFVLGIEIFEFWPFIKNFLAS
ncbi:MAG: diacylglycerol kinase [Sulfurospirillum sp.]|nr:diacylglycerol kinase [Sulfurospirillum sp.]